MRNFRREIQSRNDIKKNRQQKAAIGILWKYFDQYLMEIDQGGLAGFYKNGELIASFYFGPQITELDWSLLKRAEDWFYQIDDEEFWQDIGNGQFRVVRVLSGKMEHNEG